MKIYSQPKSFQAFMLGLLSATQIQVIGYLSIAELFFAIMAPFYIIKKWRVLVDSKLRSVLILLLGWFASALATDFIYRDTAVSLALKGALTPVLWATALISMYFLLKDRIVLIKWFICGAAISGVVSLYIFKPGSLIGLDNFADVDVEYGFRILIGVISTFIWAAVLLLYPRHAKFTLTVILVFGVACFLQGSRSTGAIFILAGGIFLVAPKYVSKNQLSRSINTRGRTFLIGVFALFFTIIISQMYSFVVREGYLGEFEKQRYLEQSQTKIGILGGRSEFVSAYYAILDSPILGHGSWARDEEGYRLKGAKALGLDLSLSRDTSEMLIPAHSHFWGPWISHGFLGFLVWLFMLRYVVKFFLACTRCVNPYMPFGILIGLSSIWNILFSPVGFRPLGAACYAFMILFLEIYERNSKVRLNRQINF